MKGVFALVVFIATTNSLKIARNDHYHKAQFIEECFQELDINDEDRQRLFTNEEDYATLTNKACLMGCLMEKRLDRPRVLSNDQKFVARRNVMRSFSRVHDERNSRHNQVSQSICNLGEYTLFDRDFVGSLPKRSCQSAAVVAAYVRANTTACEPRISPRRAIKEIVKLVGDLKSSDEYNNVDEGIYTIAEKMGISGMMPPADQTPLEDEPTVQAITEPLPVDYIAESATTEDTPSASDLDESETRVEKNVELNLITVEGDVNMKFGKD